MIKNIYKIAFLSLLFFAKIQCAEVLQGISQMGKSLSHAAEMAEIATKVKTWLKSPEAKAIATSVVVTPLTTWLTIPLFLNPQVAVICNSAIWLGWTRAHYLKKQNGQILAANAIYRDGIDAEGKELDSLKDSIKASFLTALATVAEETEDINKLENEFKANQEETARKIAALAANVSENKKSQNELRAAQGISKRKIAKIGLNQRKIDLLIKRINTSAQDSTIVTPIVTPDVSSTVNLEDVARKNIVTNKHHVSGTVNPKRPNL